MGQYETVKAFTAKKIRRLLEMPDPASRAALANLRRGIGHAPGELPQLWGEFLADMPEELQGERAASFAEWAVYTAVTMFALHQQGKDRKGEAMNREGVSVGAAANQLIASEDDRERVARRFYPVATAADMTEMAYHLRGLISLFRANGIALDYPMLAGDLFLLQSQNYADSVKMRWGRDFCRYRTQTSDTPED